MKRKFFLKNCGLACLTATTLSNLLQSCVTMQHDPIEIIRGSDMVISLDEFKQHRKGITTYKKYLITQPESLSFPICIFRFDEQTYVALWMQCSHMGTQLQVSGNTLTCPAHGSEFTNKGLLQRGPAATALRTFPAVVKAGNLTISLKAI